MRHGMANRKLGRTSGHRAALFRNQLASLITRERIVTTLVKAKELRPLVEKLVTLGRDDSVHNRRQAARVVEPEALSKLFDTVAPRFADRPGGYTRIVKLGPRRGDGAEMAIIEFVDFKLETEKPAAPAKEAKGGKSESKPATKAERAAEPDEAEEETKEAAPSKKPAKKKAKPPAKPAAKAKAGAKKEEKPKKKTGTKKKSGK
ncbi:MAG TPA: 50S ribosomal protein L17 [Thermoanaerobaculia bacterium]|nr:50S ribosomal protein L17 [Thermoanaerobaculia bacterium]